MCRHLLAHRAQQQCGKPSATARTQHQRLGAGPGVDQGFGRVARQGRLFDPGSGGQAAGAVRGCGQHGPGVRGPIVLTSLRAHLLDVVDRVSRPDLTDRRCTLPGGREHVADPQRQPPFGGLERRPVHRVQAPFRAVGSDHDPVLRRLRGTHGDPLTLCHRGPAGTGDAIKHIAGTTTIEGHVVTAPVGPLSLSSAVHHS